MNVMNWPSLFPDLAPIEHQWDELGRRVYGRDLQPANVQELERALLHKWQRILQNVIARLIHSMRRRFSHACPYSLFRILAHASALSFVVLKVRDINR